MHSICYYLFSDVFFGTIVSFNFCKKVHDGMIRPRALPGACPLAAPHRATMQGPLLAGGRAPRRAMPWLRPCAPLEPASCARAYRARVPATAAGASPGLPHGRLPRPQPPGRSRAPSGLVSQRAVGAGQPPQLDHRTTGRRAGTGDVGAEATASESSRADLPVRTEPLRPGAAARCLGRAPRRCGRTARAGTGATGSGAALPRRRRRPLPGRRGRHPRGHRARLAGAARRLPRAAGAAAAGPPGRRARLAGAARRLPRAAGALPARPPRPHPRRGQRGLAVAPRARATVGSPSGQPWPRAFAGAARPVPPGGPRAPLGAPSPAAKGRRGAVRVFTLTVTLIGPAGPLAGLLGCAWRLSEPAGPRWPHGPRLAGWPPGLFRHMFGWTKFIPFIFCNFRHMTSYLYIITILISIWYLNLNI
jgi:hypothetical protein